MTKPEKLAAIESLTIVLTDKIEYYNQCVKNDEILEVRKTLRLQIKEIQKQIEILQDTDSQPS